MKNIVLPKAKPQVNKMELGFKSGLMFGLGFIAAQALVFILNLMVSFLFLHL